MKKLHIVFLVLIAIAISAVQLIGIVGCEQPQEEIVLSWPTIWVGQDSKAASIAALVDQFNAENEGSIKVEIEPNPDYDAYRDKINALIAAGNVPDIFVFNPDATTFQYYEGDLLMDFTDDLQGSWGNQFVPGAIADATRNGRTKSLPFEIALTPIWYNEALFQQAGIDEFPRTIDEFWVAADKLVAAGITPTSQMTGGSNAWTSMLWYSHFVASIGGENVWSRRLPDRQFSQAAEIMKRIYQNYTTRDAIGGDAAVSGGHYLAGNTAMFINGPWYIGRVRSDAPDVYENTKIAPAPAVSGGAHGHQIGFQLSNLAAANTDDPARREAVITFLKWMTAPNNVRSVSIDSGSLFAIQFNVGNATLDHLQKQFIEAASAATFVVPHFQSQYPTDLVAEFGQNLGALALDQIDSREFAAVLAGYDN